MNAVRESATATKLLWGILGVVAAILVSAAGYYVGQIGVLHQADANIAQRVASVEADVRSMKTDHARFDSKLDQLLQGQSRLRGTAG